MVSGEIPPRPAAFRPHALRSRAAHAPFGAGTTRFPRTGVSSRQGARPQPAASEDVSSCQCSPPLLAAPACSGRRQPGSQSRQAVCDLAASPSRCLCGRSNSISRGSSGSALTSFISELACYEVPGFGAPALPSALGLKALALALAIARGPRRLRIRPAVANLPPPPRQPAGVPSAETWSSLPVQRHPRGSNRVGEEGRVNEELSGRPGQERLCDFE